MKATKIAAVSLQIDHVAARYWHERGQYHGGADNTSRDLARLVDYFGPTTVLTDIDDAGVAKLVAWRRGQRRDGWSIDRQRQRAEPHHHRHAAHVVRLRQVRVRGALSTNRTGGGTRSPSRWSASASYATTRPSGSTRRCVTTFEPFFAFVRATGMRKEASADGQRLIRDARQIVKLGKGGKRITFPITATVRAILEPLQGHHPDVALPYAATRRRDGRVQGGRYPLTLSG